MSNSTPTEPNSDWSFRVEQPAPGSQSGARASSRPERVQTLAEWLRSQWVLEQMARAVPSSIAEGFGAPVEEPKSENGTAVTHESASGESPSSAASTSTASPPAKQRSPASPTPHPSPQSSSPMP